MVQYVCGYRGAVRGKNRAAPVNIPLPVCRSRSTRLPAAPDFESHAPKTTRGRCAFKIAPAHMGHGSSVTYSVHCHSRQPPSVRQASPMASSSAWASAVFPFSRRLRPRPTMRSSSVITHPTGTSPSAAASCASRSASRIIASSKSVHTPPRQESFYHTRKWKIRQHPLCGAFLGKTGFLLAFNRRTRYTEYIRQRRCKEWMEERITTV